MLVTDDVQGTLDAMKPLTAMYVGGMGHKDINFHKDAMARMGFPEAAQRIQELFLAGRRAEAVQAVPDEYLDEGAMLGTPERIREKWKAWDGCGATGLTLHTRQPEAMELLAALAGTRDA